MWNGTGLYLAISNCLRKYDNIFKNVSINCCIIPSPQSYTYRVIQEEWQKKLKKRPLWSSTQEDVTVVQWGSSCWPQLLSIYGTVGKSYKFVFVFGHFVHRLVLITWLTPICKIWWSMNLFGHFFSSFWTFLSTVCILHSVFFKF